MRKVSAKEFTQMLKELKEPGESISFVLDFESEAESTDEDDYYGWWSASRVQSGTEAYTVLHQCGGITFDTVVFDSPDIIDEEDIRGFLLRHTDLPDCITVKELLPIPEKKYILSVIEQIEPEIRNLLDVYYGPGELRVRLDDDDITCIERAAGEVINIQRKGIAVGLRFCKDSVIVAAYEALLSQIAIDLESCKR